MNKNEIVINPVTFKPSYLDLLLELKGITNKFLPGIKKWEEQGIINLSNADDISRIRLMLKVLEKTPGYDFFDELLNGESPDRVCKVIGLEQFKTSRESNISFDYKIIPINTFEDAIEIAAEESWCIVISKEAYNDYTKKGNRFYFLCNKNWEFIHCIPGQKFPYDEYGYSLIAVEMSPENKIISVTSRWNTGSCNNDFFISEDELRNILGVKFKALYIYEGRFK